MQGKRPRSLMVKPSAFNGMTTESVSVGGTKLNIMSRTTRKDKRGVKYSDGNLKALGVHYTCSCSYCLGIDKRLLNKKILDREMLRDIKEVT